MQVVQMLLPAVATAALGVVLLVPARDDRRGRRATIASGLVPFRLRFSDETGASPPGAQISRDAPPAGAATNPDALADRCADVATGAVAHESHLDAEGNQASSLLEPLAAVMAFAKPLLRLRTVWRRYVQAPLTTATRTASDDAGLQTAADAEPASESAAVGAGRQFAGELAALLGTPQTSALGIETVPPVAAVLASVDSAQGQSMGADSSASRSTATTWAAGHAPADDGERQSAGCDDENGVPSADAATGQQIVVVGKRAPLERMAPLTRLPLRPQVGAITWASACDGTASRSEPASSEPSRTERHALLEGMIRERGSVSSEVLEAAYRQEDSAGRALALRAYLRHFPSAGRALFGEALRSGSDEERSIAIDGLAALDARDELTVAFDDRLDALAAKAALAYVGTLSREDFRTGLAPFIDAERINAILTLLAGIVE